MKKSFPNEWQNELCNRKKLEEKRMIEQQEIEEYESRLQTEESICNICNINKLVIYRNVNIYITEH